MEEAELDEWFSEQRERLEERFYAEALKNSDKAKERFDKDYRALVAEFQKRQGQIYEHKMSQARLRAPIARMRERTRLFFARISDWIRGHRHVLKKWLFERKIRRILKDKSDL